MQEILNIRKNLIIQKIHTYNLQAMQQGGDIEIEMDVEESSDTDPDSRSEDRLNYGSQGSELSALVDIELEQVGVGEGWMEDTEMEELLQEEGDIVMNAQHGDDPGCDVKSGEEYLKVIDKHFMSSPRMVVRGRYRGEDLELIVRRKTEGTYVSWGLFNTKTNKQALLVHGNMNYPFGLSLEALRHPDHWGKEVLGGWEWQGWGYGYLNLNLIGDFFPLDPRELHVDINEAVLFGKEILLQQHVSGQDCVNVDHTEDVNCRVDGCGTVIWRIKFSTFSTVEDESNKLASLGLAPATYRKEKEEQNIYLSLVAFSHRETKIAIHQEEQLIRCHEEVMWLTKDGAVDDSVAAVDLGKLEKAELIWQTQPKVRKTS